MAFIKIGFKPLIRFFLCFLSTLQLNNLAADPWGKDADLVHAPSVPCHSSFSSPLDSIGEALIRFHQDVISPIDGPRSHYRPSSSQYAADAIKMYGFLPGVALGCDRLLRENSDAWVYDKVPFDGTTLKWDPVDGSRSTFKELSVP